MVIAAGTPGLVVSLGCQVLYVTRVFRIRGFQAMRHMHPSPNWRNIPARYFAIPLVTLMLLLGVASPAAAGEEGSWLLQCGCPLDWTDTWLGDASFDDENSLDTVALVNDDGAVVMMHEVPLDSSDVETMLLDRSADLEDHEYLEDVDIVWEDVNRTEAEAGRTWVDASGTEFVSFQSVVVWEVNYLLSIELISPAAAFEDAWADLEDVSLIGTPLLDAHDGDEIAAELGL